jgi:hypothetical protein
MLILWRWEEAESCEGENITGSVGGHMKYVREGDVLYPCAISNGDVHLLGSLRVEKVGREPSAARRRIFGPYVAKGKSRFGAYGIFPLGSLKWRLRFDGTDADRLHKNTPLGLQLRSRRYLTSESARLLDEVLKKRRNLRPRNLAAFRMEGERIIRAMTVRERDRTIRRDAIRRYGRKCRICGIDLAQHYGRFAADCIEVHHLDPIGERSTRGGRTALDKVIVVCPNCHRALHCFEDPAAWRRFRTKCRF